MSTPKRQVTLSPYFETLPDLAATLRFLNPYLTQGFHNVEALKIRKRYLPEVLKFLESHDAEVNKTNVSGAHCINVKFGRSDIIIFVSATKYETSSVDIAFASNGKYEELIKFINALPIVETKSDNVLDLDYYYMSSRNGVSEQEITVDLNDINTIYSDLYPDIDITKLVVDYNQAKEPILMLYGDPGVGKTSFVKFIVATGEYRKIAYVKDPKVMEDGELWALLTQAKHDLIVFDDLDIELLPRRKNSESTFMSQLLSYSDGIFSQSGSKIIITTNQEVREIDSALVRPGRCFDFIRLSPLQPLDAAKFWEGTLKLDREMFLSVFGGRQEITQAALMSEAARHLAAQDRGYIKNGNRRYTLDQKLADLGIKTGSTDSKASF